MLWTFMVPGICLTVGLGNFVKCWVICVSTWDHKSTQRMCLLTGHRSSLLTSQSWTKTLKCPGKFLIGALGRGVCGGIALYWSC